MRKEFLVAGIWIFSLVIIFLLVFGFDINLSNKNNIGLSFRLTRTKFVFPGIRFSFPEIAVDPALAEKVNLEYQKLIDNNQLGFKELPFQRPSTIMSLGSEKISLEELAKRAHKQGMKTLVWLGIGGQGNGNKSIHYTLEGKDMNVIVVDNLEGWFINQILSELDPETTMVGVSSKSFSTDETMGNALIALTWLSNFLGKEKALEQVIFNTDNVEGANVKGSNKVNEIANAFFGQDAKYVFPISALKDGNIYDVGGRYSVLMSGIISSTLAGIKAENMLAAAREVEIKNGKAEMNDALDLALHTAAAFEAGKDVLVIVATSPRLRRVAEWIKQHTGESLGKDGKGPHPYVVVAESNEDLKNLYASSEDKVFLFLKDSQQGFDLEVPQDISNIVYEFSDVDEANLGAYFQFFNEWAVRFALALGLNPVTQPWVEKGKAGASTYAEYEKSPYSEITRSSISFNAEKTGIDETKAAGLQSRIESILGEISLLTPDEIVASYNRIKSQLGENYVLDIKDITELERGIEYARTNLEKLASEMAIYAYLLEESGVKIMYNVFYNLSLEAFGLWVEELSRERLVDKGVVVTKAIGSLNQHDLLQLWGDGPAISYLNGVIILDKTDPVAITENPFFNREKLDALEGKDTGFISDCMWEKIANALKKEGRPTSTLFIPELNDYYLGQIFALYDMFTQIYSGLLE